MRLLKGLLACRVSLLPQSLVLSTLVQCSPETYRYPSVANIRSSRYQHRAFDTLYCLLLTCNILIAHRKTPGKLPPRGGKPLLSGYGSEVLLLPWHRATPSPTISNASHILPY